MKLRRGGANPLSVAAVHHIDDGLRVGVVAPPIWPDTRLPAQVPNLRTQLFGNKPSSANAQSRADVLRRNTKRKREGPTWNLMFLYVTVSTLNPMAATHSFVKVESEQCFLSTSKT